MGPAGYRALPSVVTDALVTCPPAGSAGPQHDPTFLVYVADIDGMPTFYRQKIRDFLWTHMQEKVPLETIEKAEAFGLCTEGGDILGAALLFQGGTEMLDLQYLCVHTNRRREGIGSEILNQVKWYIEEYYTPTPSMLVGLGPCATAAHATDLQGWYERRGFVPREHAEKSLLLEWNPTVGGRTTG